jgi:hypothetical protein
MLAKKRELADFRDDYATCSDFCEVFHGNAEQFYLPAFLLTADDREAEACFLAAMEESSIERNVFRGWEKAWSRRCVVMKAISAIASAPLRGDEQREGCGQRACELELGTLLRAVVRLEPAERIVFVATVLDRFSVHECALLLSCPAESVTNMKLQAMCHLSEFAAENISDADLPATEKGWKWSAARELSWSHATESRLFGKLPTTGQ